MRLEHRIDGDRIEHLELTSRQVSDHRAPQALRIGPGPDRALVLVAKRQRYLVDHEVRVAMVGEGKHRDLKRRIALVIGRNFNVQPARVEFDDTIEERFAAVGLALVFDLEKRSSLLSLLADAGASGKAGQRSRGCRADQ
jgi:hypothetical protein